MAHPSTVGPGGKNRPYKAKCLRESESHVFPYLSAVCFLLSCLCHGHLSFVKD